MIKSPANYRVFVLLEFRKAKRINFLKDVGMGSHPSRMTTALAVVHVLECDMVTLRGESSSSAAFGTQPTFENFMFLKCPFGVSLVLRHIHVGNSWRQCGPEFESWSCPFWPGPKWLRIRYPCSRNCHHVFRTINQFASVYCAFVHCSRALFKNTFCTVGQFCTAFMCVFFSPTVAIMRPRIHTCSKEV